MSPRLFAGHHHVPHAVRVEVAGPFIEERFRVSGQYARDEAVAQESAHGVASVGVEAVADDRLAIAYDVGRHRDHGGGHAGEVDDGVPDIGAHARGRFADVQDAHGLPRGVACGGALLVGVVGGAHERAGRNMVESHRIALAFEVGELAGMVEAIHRRVRR